MATGTEDDSHIGELEMEKTAMQVAMEKAVDESQAKGRAVDPVLLFEEGQLVRRKITYVARVLDTRKEPEKRASDVELTWVSEPFPWKKEEISRNWEDYKILTDILAAQEYVDPAFRIRWTWIKDVQYVAAEV